MAVRILWHKCLDSTNSEVRRRISQLDNLSVTAAWSQSAGRGQADHKWHSAPGENLTFTLLLKFTPEFPLKARDALLQKFTPESPLKARDALLLTETITYALREFLASEGVISRIKWPNDIYVGELKICGILIENILEGDDVAASIIGVGLNLNQTVFPPDIPNPTSLALLTGRSYPPEAALEKLCAYIETSVELLRTPEGRERLDEYFNAHMFRRAPGD